MADAYLVLFVADPAGDDHAAALRGVAREIPDAGFFDGPDAQERRTVGTYVKVAAAADGIALVRAVAAVSRTLGARIEVQHAERVVGHLEAGRPDAALVAAVGPLGDIPEAI